jgi:hypothetical protein
LGELAARLDDPKLARLLADLERILYGQEGGQGRTWDGSGFWREMAPGLTNQGEPGKSVTESPLPPLHPG